MPYPNDADGAVLSYLDSQGVDMAKPLLIEFAVAVPDERSARECARLMSDAGYNSRTVYDEGEPDFDPSVDDPDEFGPSWTAYADVRMIPGYDEIVRIQHHLDQITDPFGGKSDGWGVLFDNN